MGDDALQPNPVPCETKVYHDAKAVELKDSTYRSAHDPDDDPLFLFQTTTKEGPSSCLFCGECLKRARLKMDSSYEGETLSYYNTTSSRLLNGAETGRRECAVLHDAIIAFKEGGLLPNRILVIINVWYSSGLVNVQMHLSISVDYESALSYSTGSVDMANNYDEVNNKLSTNLAIFRVHSQCHTTSSLTVFTYFFRWFMPLLLTTF